MRDSVTYGHCHCPTLPLTDTATDWRGTGFCDFVSEPSVVRSQSCAAHADTTNMRMNAHRGHLAQHFCEHGARLCRVCLTLPLLWTDLVQGSGRSGIEFVRCTRRQRQPKLAKSMCNQLRNAMGLRQKVRRVPYTQDPLQTKAPILACLLHPTGMALDVPLWPTPDLLPGRTRTTVVRRPQTPHAIDVVQHFQT